MSGSSSDVGVGGANGANGAGPTPDGSRRARVLFACVENSNRSQMAEAFARLEGGDSIDVESAGSAPSGRVNAKAVEAMAELGYDLTTHRSKGLDEVAPGDIDVLVTMGCGDACPAVPARRREDWQVPDPKDLPAERFRAVRDDIHARVRELLRGL